MRVALRSSAAHFALRSDSKLFPEAQLRPLLGECAAILSASNLEETGRDLARLCLLSREPSPSFISPCSHLLNIFIFSQIKTNLSP